MATVYYADIINRVADQLSVEIPEFSEARGGTVQSAARGDFSNGLVAPIMARVFLGDTQNNGNVMGGNAQISPGSKANAPKRFTQFEIVIEVYILVGGSLASAQQTDITLTDRMQTWLESQHATPHFNIDGVKGIGPFNSVMSVLEVDLTDNTNRVYLVRTWTVEAVIY